MRFRAAPTRIAVAAAFGGLALALVAGCSKTAATNTAQAPPPGSNPAPAAGPPPTTTAVATGSQAFQPYTVLPTLPPAPANVVDTNRTLTMVQHSGGWYLRDHAGHYYHAARDSQGHFYPAYTGPNGHYYPLRYDASRNRYFRIIRTNSGDSYRNYVGDPSTRYYQDPGMQNQGQSQLAGYNDPYNQPTYQPTIIQPRSHSNKNLWWLALPVLVGAYLLLKNQHHGSPSYRYGQPSSIVRYYNGQNGSLMPMRGRGPSGGGMPNMGMNRNGNSQMSGGHMMPLRNNSGMGNMGSMGGSFGHAVGSPAHGHFAPLAHKASPGFTPPGRALGRQPGFTPPGRALGRKPGFTPPGHAIGRKKGAGMMPAHGAPAANIFTARRTAPAAHPFAPRKPVHVQRHRTVNPVHSTPFRLQPPARNFGQNPAGHPGNAFGQGHGRGPAKPPAKRSVQPVRRPAQPSRFVPHPAPINNRRVVPKGNPFRAPGRPAHGNKQNGKKKGK